MCLLNQKGRVEAVERRRYPVRQRADRLFSHAEAVRAPAAARSGWDSGAGRCPEIVLAAQRFNGVAA